MWKGLIVIATLGAMAGIFLIPINPVNSKPLKLAWLACMLLAWGGLMVLNWKRRPWRFLVLLLPIPGILPFTLPGGEMDSEVLRLDYVRRMNGFKGTRYFWGGESSRGIDCSGLPRRALRDSLMAYGLRHLNGPAFRAWAEQWWFDASARALGEGYRNYTSPLGVSGTIRKMNYGNLIPGDLAVTADGVHVLAYTGAGTWIQADPGVGSVVSLEGRTADNVWFDMPVTLHRWQIFGDGKVSDGE